MPSTLVRNVVAGLQSVPAEAIDAGATREIVLTIQREEFGMNITADDQPDLVDPIVSNTTTFTALEPAGADLALGCGGLLLAVLDP